MVNNWQIILEDQITSLKQCGLINIADQVMISYSNNNKEVLSNFIDPLIGDISNTILTTAEATSAPWGGQAMNMIHEYCKNQPSPQTAAVFYFHNKGASKWRADWKDHFNDTWSYSHSLYWRKYLEYFLIERPSLCLEKILLQNATTCGANWHPKMNNHYSGNFWSASCEHIQQLQPMTGNDTNYVAAEMWLGRVKGRHANLFTTAKNLYNELIMPKEYAFE